MPSGVDAAILQAKAKEARWIYRRDKLGGSELGIYLGVLVGIAVLQTTGQIVGLVLCPIVGFVFGTLLGRITHQINLRHEGFEEE